MNTIINLKNRNMVFYSLIIIAVIYILIANQAGKKQDNRYLNDFQEYQTVVNLINQQKYSEAQPIVINLLSKYPSSYVVIWQNAIVLDGLGNYEEAERYYSLVERQRPFVVKNQYFLVQHGKVLYRLGNHQEAAKYFMYSKKINAVPELTKLSEELLAEINKR